MSALLQFCLDSNKELKFLSGDPLFERFYKLRYWELTDRFPHKVFTVGEATLDFFIVTANYLQGAKLPKNEDKSEYLENYLNWIKQHRIKC